MNIDPSLVVKIMFPALGKGEQVAYKYIAPLIEERRKRIEADESQPKPVSSLCKFGNFSG